MAEVVLDDVTKVYPDGTAGRLGPRTFDIDDGEFMVFVGPSGCGKTTALRMVAGLEDITSGTISIGDRVVNDVPSKDRDVAMVFQNYALYPHLKVYDNMAFGLQLRKIDKSEIDRRVRDAATGPRPRGAAWTASPRTSREASASGSRWDARSCASPARS